MTYKYKYTAIFDTWDGKNLTVGQILEQERNVGFTREWMEIIWNGLQMELMNYGAAHVGLKVEALLEINGELARIFRLSFYTQDMHPSKLYYTLQTTGMRANDPYEWRTLREGDAGRMNPNNKTVTVKITRRQLCDLMLACSWITGDLQISGKSTDKWEALHERLQECLTAHDKHEEEKRW